MPACFLIVMLLGASGYETSIEHWRAEREAKLRAEDGWLSLAGLFWLEEGANRIGSAANTPVQLPAGFPGDAGVLTRRDENIHFSANPGAGVRLNGQPVKEAAIRTDKAENPDRIQIGRLTLLVIQRGSKIGVRLKDPQSEARTHFHGLRWFPVNERWRVRARFVHQEKKLTVDAQAGDKQEYLSPGYVEWSHRGQKLRLTPVLEEGQLFFIFRDTTAGETTYPAARFLYTEQANDGFVILDFNKAYNPPCVFTPYATCPLPPAENRLKIPVQAGEMMYPGH